MTFSRCYEVLLGYGGRRVQEVYEKWRSLKGYEPVHDYVMGIEHGTLYGLTVEEIEYCCDHTEHALGTISKSRLAAHPLFGPINDYSVPFAFVHLLHMLMERRGRIPLWREVIPFFMEEIPEHFVTPYRAHFGYKNQDAYSREILDTSMAWRLGLAYYSFLREVDLFIRLRQEHALDVHYHLFADVTLRADFWADGTIISLFVKNSKYKTRTGGRKRRTSEFFTHNENLRFVDIDLSNKSKRGVVWLVPQAKIMEAAVAIKEGRNKQLT